VAAPSKLETLTRTFSETQALDAPRELGSTGITIESLTFLYGSATGYAWLGRFAPNREQMWGLANIPVAALDRFFPEFIDDIQNRRTPEHQYDVSRRL